VVSKVRAEPAVGTAASAAAAKTAPAAGTVANAAAPKARVAPAAGNAAGRAVGAGRAEHSVPARRADTPAGATDAIVDGTVKVYRNRSIDFLFFAGGVGR